MNQQGKPYEDVAELFGSIYACIYVSICVDVTGPVTSTFDLSTSSDPTSWLFPPPQSKFRGSPQLCLRSSKRNFRSWIRLRRDGPGKFCQEWKLKGN